MSGGHGVRLVPALLLVGVTAIWGWTFVVVKDAIAHYPVVSFLGVRFLLAAVALWVLVLVAHQRGRVARAGLAIGIVLALSYLLQTLGLKGTSVANTGLITGLFVVFTPILDRVLWRVPSQGSTWIAAGVAFVGTALLTGGAPTGLHAGDLLVLAASIGFALHITLLSRYAAAGPLLLASWQMTAAGILLSTGAVVTHSTVLPVPGSILPALAITGIFASALAFWIQTYAQQRLPASRAALILTMEPVFTVFFAFLLVSERFRFVQALGAVLILLALFYSELRQRQPIGAAAPALPSAIRPPSGA
ncbi:MAG: DMT family transporter [Candidatus Dormibacteraeota bacterium]|nr:DMT family transporter [Candidatus Dormibacteraeota bacterium]